MPLKTNETIIRLETVDRLRRFGTLSWAQLTDSRGHSDRVAIRHAVDELVEADLARVTVGGIRWVGPHEAEGPSPAVATGDAKLAPNRMTAEETETAIVLLVESRYPYQVAEALSRITYFGDTAVVVAAALARSVDLGERRGADRTKKQIAERLGL